MHLDLQDREDYLDHLVKLASQEMQDHRVNLVFLDPPVLEDSLGLQVNQVLLANEVALDYLVPQDKEENLVHLDSLEHLENLDSLGLLDHVEREEKLDLEDHQV